MEHAPGVRDALVDGAVDARRGPFHHPVALVDLAPGVGYEEVACLHLGEVPAPRVDEKPGPFVVGGVGEVIADRLVVAEPGRPSERGGEIGSGLTKRVVHGVRLLRMVWRESATLNPDPVQIKRDRP